jgi:hypothetical protein
MRVLSVMVVHLQQQFPDVAQDWNQAWQKIKSGVDKLEKHAESQSTGAHPPLGFSGASMGAQQVGQGGPSLGQQ